MTTLQWTEDGVVAYTKGAPEVILEACSRQLTDNGPEPIDASATEAIRDAAAAMARRALRVLAVAMKTDVDTEDVKAAEKGMTFLGLIGILDPPRPEAKDAIRTCVRVGIKPILITGDHPETAQAVAVEL